VAWEGQNAHFPDEPKEWRERLLAFLDTLGQGKLEMSPTAVAKGA
jgi:hypothetical protein